MVPIYFVDLYHEMSFLHSVVCILQLPGFVNVTSPGVCLEDLHEEEPHNMTVGISIQNLVKIYDDVSITLFNRIT